MQYILVDIINITSFLIIGPCTDFSTRITGTSVPYIGRVEICIDQQWTTLCQSDWGINEAKVVCKELGYSNNGM